MRTAVKAGLLVLAGLVALLLLNAVALSRQTRDAEVTVDGGRIVATSIGDLQVLDEGDPEGSPIVLIHCYACSLRWWDRLAPLLADDHRVVRVDLLGHGGSEKPKGGYEISEQAAGVAEALAGMDVADAVVVGHSLGGSVATELASRSPGLVAGVVDIGAAPDHSFGKLSFLARLGYVPVIGEAVNRLARVGPAALVKDSYKQAFAPGYNISSGFENPDQVVEDLRAMTYTAYDDAAAAATDYADEEPLDQRLAATGLPVLVIFGAEDQIFDAEASVDAFDSVPGARTELIAGAGHSPNVETPEEVARLIREFATDLAQPAPGARRARPSTP